MNPEVQQVAFDAFKRGVYMKNIHYIFDPRASVEEFAYVRAVGASPAQSAWMIQQAHYRVGVQMQVAKSVTDDLLATDFSGAASVTDIPWPAPVVEVYFQDPMLPTILVMKCSPKDLEKWFPQLDIGLTGDEYITGLMQEGSKEGAMALSVQLKPDMYHEFLTTGKTVKMNTGILSHDLSQQDNAAMAYMLHLALKVFVFASIPKFKPAPLHRKQMTYGGKPLVRGRPYRPAFHVTYLPQVKYQLIPAKVSDETMAREFHGRRGHIHWYHSERFVNRKGTWDFIAPVIDPATGKYPEHNIIKVRKP